MQTQLPEISLLHINKTSAQLLVFRLHKNMAMQLSDIWQCTN